GYTVGVLVQCNYGDRDQLRIAGVPVGKEIPENPAYGRDQGSIIVVVATDAPLIPTQLKRVARRVTLGLGRDGSYSGDGSGDIFIAFTTANGGAIRSDRDQLRIAGVPVGKEIPENPAYGRDQGSIIVVVATDAPLIPTQLQRVARRVTLGLGRDGSYSGDGSGDIFIAFTTANGGAIGAKEKHEITMLPNEQLDPIFLATVQATEEAVINAMVAAATMTGINDHKVIVLPHERLREVLR